MIEKPILLDLPLPIITPRLKIVRPDPRYAEEIVRAKEESLDQLLPWMGWARNGAGTVDETREMLIRKQAKFILREDLMMLAFTHDGEFVVSTGLHEMDWRIPSAMIGYWAKTSATGKGYVTETANALLRYGFGQIGLRKISICMDSENRASENVARRLGMTLEYRERGGSHAVFDNLIDRYRLSYAAFGTENLPPLDVRW